MRTYSTYPTYGYRFLNMELIITNWKFRSWPLRKWRIIGYYFNIFFTLSFGCGGGHDLWKSWPALIIILLDSMNTLVDNCCRSYNLLDGNGRNLNFATLFFFLNFYKNILHFTSLNKVPKVYKRKSIVVNPQNYFLFEGVSALLSGDKENELTPRSKWWYIIGIHITC